MGIQANFNTDEVRAYAYSKREKWEENLLDAYKRACINMVNRAKRTNTYKDQTGKLRASIGCVIYYKGVEIFNYFGGSDGESEANGVLQGKAYARRRAEEVEDGVIVAVVVAGAEYARYVEANGFDVLTGSSYGFQSDLEREILDAQEAFKQHISTKFGING